MAGAFLALLILLCMAGFAIVEGILYYLAQLIYIIFSIIIYSFKNKNKDKKKDEKIVNNSYKAYQPNPTPFRTENEKFYCERCFKRISKEEYEMNDCMCEDCYTDVNYSGEDF